MSISLFQRIKYFFKGLKPLILSHHPKCEKFDEHSFIIKGKRFCYGCYIGWPVTFITIIISMIIQIQTYFSLGDLFNMGFILCCSYVLSLIKLTKIKIIKIISKVLIGIGLGFIISSIILTEFPLWFKILIILVFLQITTVGVNLKRIYEIEKICKQCSYNEDWDNCPGMKESMYYFNLSGFTLPRKKNHTQEHETTDKLKNDEH
jgi:hypothetical protein